MLTYFECFFFFDLYRIHRKPAIHARWGGVPGIFLPGGKIKIPGGYFIKPNFELNFFSFHRKTLYRYVNRRDLSIDIIHFAIRAPIDPYLTIKPILNDLRHLWVMESSESKMDTTNRKISSK